MNRRPIPLLVAILALAALAPPRTEAANRLYDKYRASLVSYSAAGLSAPVDVATDTIRIACVTSAYTPNTAADQFYSSVASAAVGTPSALTYASSAAGVYKSATPISYTIPATTTVTYLVIYKDTGSAATSPLIAIYDTGSNLPITTGSASGTINLTMDAVNGWFKP